jgi:hypothetical protein
LSTISFFFTCSQSIAAARIEALLTAPDVIEAGAGSLRRRRRWLRGFRFCFFAGRSIWLALIPFGQGGRIVRVLIPHNRVGLAPDGH